MRRLTFGLLALIALTGFKPVTFTRADAPVRTSEITVLKVPVYAGASITAGTDGVVSSMVPLVSVVPADTTVATSFAPPPYAARLRVNTHDAGSATTPALTCSACDIRGVNALGVPVSERVLSIDESTERLTANSYEQVTSFTCTGCVTDFDGTDVVKLHVSRHISVPVPIGGAGDILAVCRTLANDVTANWVCVPGVNCPVNPVSQSVEAAACRVGTSTSASAAWTAADNESIRIRARASAAPVLLYAR